MMLKRSSLIACFICLFALVTIRILNVDKTSKTYVNVISWDALAYYMYLPGIFIYHDMKELAWYPHIDSTYSPTGNFYQASRYKNGNYVMKYFMGTAILCSPFVFVAHQVCPYLGYPPDGFSVPYQIAVCIASIFYSFIALLVLRILLLRYFSEKVTATALLLMALGTNYLEYAGVACGFTHSYLFAIYAFQLYATIRWYEKPAKSWAFLIGYLVGFAILIRPTDAAMLLVPLFWNEFSKESSKAKWKMVKENINHIAFAGFGCFLGVLPQLIYWKYATGNWVYDVGSKWYFLNPYWRVLFGFEKGWFVYTPIALFIVFGLFFQKNKPFKRATIIYFLINTWIIIAWSDWRYGGTYSCRALMQSYAILILPMAAFVEWTYKQSWKYWMIALWVYLVGVNIFQLYQYDKQIIHYDDMNRKYYAAIYLNPHPTPLDASLLDTDERLEDESPFTKRTIYILRDSLIALDNGDREIASIPLKNIGEDEWLKISLDGVTKAGLWHSYLQSEITFGDSVDKRRIRLYNELNKENKETKVEFYQRIPNLGNHGMLKLSLSSELFHQTAIHKLEVIQLQKSE